MFNEAYIIQRQQPAKMGGLIDTIMQGVSAVGQSLGGLQNLFGGGSSGSGSPRYKGLQAITQGTQEVLSALDSLISQIGQQPYELLLQQAQQAVAALSNPAIFYQAQRGQDAQVLAQAKTTAQQKLQQIASRATIPSGGNIVTTTTNQAGQVITSTGNAITTGLDSGASVMEQLTSGNTLLYVGLGAALVYLLKK